MSYRKTGSDDVDCNGISFGMLSHLLSFIRELVLFTGNIIYSGGRHGVFVYEHKVQ
jgi:hypothetical protein